MARTLHISLCVLIGLFGIANTSDASVVDAALWRLGDADPGAVAGNAANATTVDSVGSTNLTLQNNRTTGSATYVSTPYSNLGIQFNSNNGDNFSYLGPDVLDGTQSNWGLQIWADPIADPSGAAELVFYEGDPGSAGMGIYMDGTNWRVLEGNVVYQQETPVVFGQWVNLALVTTGGATTFYVNYTPVDTLLPAPNPIGGETMIGGNAFDFNPFDGVLDDARIFSFESGQFAVSDLTPEPSSFVMGGLGLLGLAAHRFRRKSRS